MGTVNIASRPWDKPLRDRGFFISGHQGPSVCHLRKAGSLDRIEVELEQAAGTISLLWDARSVLGPDAAQYPFAIHPMALRQHSALELAMTQWSLVQVSAAGERNVAASGPLEDKPRRRVRIVWNGPTQADLQVDGRPAWKGEFTRGDDCLGILASPNSHALVREFVVAGNLRPAVVSFLYTEAIVGAAEKLADWKTQADNRFRHGLGAVSTRAGQMAKWNFEGTSLRLWAPKSPAYGKADLLLDGRAAGTIDFAADAEAPSQLVHEAKNLAADVPHALILKTGAKPIPLDSVDVGLAAPSAAARPESP